MDLETLERDLARRLPGLSAPQRRSIGQLLREWFEHPAGLTADAQTERQLRIEAQTLREVLEAITRQARLEDTIQEVLDQLSRLVSFDSCSLALLDSHGIFRIIAGRGFPDLSKILGLTFRAPLAEAIRRTRMPLAIEDVQKDKRFVAMDVSPTIRSWAGVPLLVEGEVIGVLCMDRKVVSPFADDELHRARAVAFSAGAAIRKDQLLAQLRRNAALLERVVAVNEAVLAGRTAAQVADTILAGAMYLAGCEDGFLILSEGGPHIAAAAGPLFAGSEGHTLPEFLAVHTPTRLDESQTAPVGRALGITLPQRALHLLPLSKPEAHLGAIGLMEPAKNAEDPLLEAYALRAATAFLHVPRE